MATRFDTPTELEEREQTALEQLIKRLADDEFVLAERYTEWQVRAPTLESDLALANNAQDELGHARLWYDVLEELGYEEQDLVYERDPTDFRHSTLVELPFEEGNWADPILRSYLYDAAEKLRLEALESSTHPKIADRVGKIQNEEGYHLEHARSWLKRLADDDKGQGKLQETLDRLFPHALTIFEPVDRDVESAIVDFGLRDATVEELGEDWLAAVVPELESFGLAPPLKDQGDAAGFVASQECLPEKRGRDGNHTDAWFDLYDEFTHTYNELDRSTATTIMSKPE
ncbi:1,2-phenylacetyl-CoA epoxidase subunit PaaC [Natronococcus roseus]|uniref:1,2-phenylacetyl-CoA epoxidase subunit PaaC n=1 Tax=Natronococcus roseus TaxID=1052014 RepID=UPI00374DB419